MEAPMTKDQFKAVLERVPTWPEDRQQELAELALEIEAELAGAEYDATPDELAAIDEGLAREAAGETEVKAALAIFRHARGLNIRKLHPVERSERAMSWAASVINWLAFRRAS